MSDKKMKVTVLTACWKCKRSSVTLRAKRDFKGKKTGIYSCEDCFMYEIPQDAYSKIQIIRGNT